MRKGSAACCFCRHGDVSTGTVQCPRGGWCGLVCALRGPRQLWPRSLQTGHSAGSEGPDGKSAPLPCPVTWLRLAGAGSLRIKIRPTEGSLRRPPVVPDGPSPRDPVGLASAGEQPSLA